MAIPDSGQALEAGGLAQERGWIRSPRSGSGWAHGKNEAPAEVGGGSRRKWRVSAAPGGAGKDSVGRGGGGQLEIRFSEYAASLFERKAAKGEMESAQTRENWELQLRLHLFPAFGEMFVDSITRTHVEAWLAAEAKKVKAGRYSPVTVNNWLRTMRVIINEAVDELGLEKNPIMKVKGLDTSNHVTYSEEEPNALTPEEVPTFLGAMRDRHPQHLAMWRWGSRRGGDLR